MRKWKKLLFYLLLGIFACLLLLLYRGYHQEERKSDPLSRDVPRLIHHLTPRFALAHVTVPSSKSQIVFGTSSSLVNKSSILLTEHVAKLSRGPTNTLPKKRGINKVLENVQNCLDATNMGAVANETLALENAREFYRQYSKVIPSQFLKNYSSHCWKMDFYVNLIKGFVYQGTIGKYPFKGLAFGDQSILLEQMTTLKQLFNGKFSSDMICLPKVFLAGFPKCGSTYLYCFLNSLIHMSTGLRLGAQTEVVKEPHFWVAVRVSKSVRMPKPTNLVEYVFNFLPGIFKAKKNNKVVLIDGTPNMLFDSPRFASEHSNTTNYCLIPSVLPVLLPMSKYVLVVRNPLKMLYSAFWFSCITKGIHVPRNVQLMGPDLFHNRIKTKFDIFNECMRDPSTIETSDVCSLYDNSDYGSCIKQRLHLLDQCVHKIFFNLFSEELPECGRSRVEMGIFYTHIRKLLMVVPRDRVLVVTLEQLAKEPNIVAKSMLDFLGLPASRSILDKVNLVTSYCSKNSQDTIPYKSDPDLKMKEETKAMILKFYKPFNELLADLLQDNRYLWNH